MREIDARELRRLLTSGGEIALIDAREEGAFSKEHIFLGSCVPLSRLEFLAPALIPRRTAPVVVADGGPRDEGLAARAAARLGEMGYADVAVLTGGVAGWRAEGFEVFSGVNVPSKAFGEFVEHHYDTPRITAAELAEMKRRGEDLVILDSRPMPEFHRMSIPGGVDCPGAELAYRVGTMAPDPSTTVVVNCAGRTRSIIGSQSLINAGIPNPVMALKDGTMGWELAGFECARGETVHAPVPEGEALEQAKARAQAVAKRFGVRITDAGTVAGWREDRDRTTFLLDVRTAEEFEAGHWPGARHAPGGQLVQATDEHVGVLGARIVLCDSADGVRATMTASWLIQMGRDDVHVLTEAAETPETGSAETEPALFRPWATLTADEMQAVQDSGEPVAVIDLADSLTFRRGHVPGALWGVRSRIGKCVASLPVGMVMLTSPDGRLAHYAAADLAAARPDLVVRVLAGGTDAWIVSGRELEKGLDGKTTTQVDDVWWKPYDHQGGVRQAMEDYLTWEVGLVAQVERDGLVEFRRFD
ncbi:rhodanese-like domain-containing protein [Minwuia thermotolerans]|uniref:Thiosulfate sulfurtransferase n=1 Tax=Minwuia thermotolerans TaxID=2056226 RepID=A0A2M9G2C1_9PROT|nr:rhodanese-like domain-containing protein [Minwuia thermotolerans]PJK29869.1 thiosulfate sulfurtransferase [Minwuia thermotolerans]